MYRGNIIGKDVDWGNGHGTIQNGEQAGQIYYVLNLILMSRYHQLMFLSCHIIFATTQRIYVYQLMTSEGIESEPTESVEERYIIHPICAWDRCQGE